MWDGWLSFGGTEIINAPRALAYMRDAFPGLKVKDPCDGNCSCDYLHAMLGDKPYASPLADDAPWVDIDRPESFRFFGAYPLGISGIEDDPTQATITEALRDGGWITNQRRGVKQVVVEAALFSADEEAASYGMAWLKSALAGSCEQGDCLPTDQLCFLTGCGDISDQTSVFQTMQFFASELATFTRHLARWNHDQLWIDDPTGYVIFNASIMCGTVDWDMQVQGNEGTVWRFWKNDTEYEDITATGENDQIIRIASDGNTMRVELVDDGGYGYPAKLWFYRVRAYGFVEQAVEDCLHDFYRSLRRVARVEGPYEVNKVYTSEGAVVQTVRWAFNAEMSYVYGLPRFVGNFAENEIIYAPTYRVGRLSANIGECTQPRALRVVDPDAPVTPPKPPPSLRASRPAPATPAREPIGVVIPDSALQTWIDSVPIIKITASSKDLKDVRVRFFPIPFDGLDPVDIDPCSACGSFEISYIPRGYTLTLDGADERAYIASDSGKTTTAAHLLTGDRNLGVMRWPVLSCGTGYLAVIDTRDVAAKVNIELAVRE